MMLPTEHEAYRVDADNGDGTYTCTPYWAAPQPAHHRPDGTLTQAGEASVKRRMSAPTMTRPDHITLPNGGERSGWAAYPRQTREDGADQRRRSRSGGGWRAGCDGLVRGRSNV